MGESTHLTPNPYENVDFWKSQAQVNNPIHDLDHLTAIIQEALPTIPSEVFIYFQWLEQRLRSSIWEEEHASPYEGE